MLTDTTPSSPRSAAAGSGPFRRARTRWSLAAALILGLVLLGALVPGVAHAAPTTAVAAGQSAAPGAGNEAAAPTPTPPATTAPVAPTVSVPSSSTGRVRITGTATPGASLRVLDPAHPASSLCTATVTARGAWGCSAVVASGADQQVTVRDLTHTALPDVTSKPFSVLTAPVFETSAGLVPGAVLRGTGFPGASVTVSLRSATGRTTAVSAIVSSSGSWQAVLGAGAVPSGQWSASAVQRSRAVPQVPTSSATIARVFTIDREAPIAPVLVHPQSELPVTKQPLYFDGSGEPRATVTAYVDSNPVCTTTVTAAGRWSCVSTGSLIPSGRRIVQAAQYDAAGNYGPPSAPRGVTFGAAATAPPATSPAPAPTSTGGGATATPRATATPDPESTASPSPTAPAGGSNGGGSGGGATGGSGGNGGAGGATGTGSGGTGSGSGSDAGGGGGTAAGSGGSAAGPNRLANESWSASTGFGGNLPSLSQSLGGFAWPGALLLGLVFLLLIIAPLRLAATALGGRVAHRARHFTGRNRASAEADDSPVLSPAATVVLTLAGGAALVALAAGVDDQVRYVRLVVGIVIGLGLLNGLGVVLPTFLAARRWGVRMQMRVSPRMLLVAALACLVTRVFSIDPPMVLGVLVAAGLATSAAPGPGTASGSDVRRRGIVATAQLGSITAVSLVAWVLHGLLPATPTDFAGQLTSETLTTVCLAGLGSLIVLLVPLGSLPGHALYLWSRPTLVGLAIVGVAAAGVVFAGDPKEAFPVVPVVFAALVVAALAVGAWVWVRFVEPAADERV